MSGDESFLARWSRRKRSAAAASDSQKNPPARAVETTKPVLSAIGEGPPAIPLPPIESIGSASDIKAFLGPGVPLELTRAALRRVWTADPAIRDFIGLSESAWDFNALGGVPGFGSLDLADVRRLMARVFNEPPEADPTSAVVAVGDDLAPPTQPDPAAPTIQPRESIAAKQHKNEDRKAREGRRHHGGALPQ
jgi:hypothetical protein